jgi:two-component system, chemotaxis family, response regulator Rcp1
MNVPATQELIPILLVEDNVGDIRLTREILSESGLPVQLCVVQNGEEAIAYLRRTGNHSNALPPTLILLDLNLPKKSGLEVLAEIKADPILRRIPVIILTTSNADHDVDQSYDLHANCFITKPIQISTFSKIISSIDSFWLQFVRFSKESE